MAKTNDYRIRAVLAIIRVSGEKETLESLHRAIEREIAKRTKAIDEAHASGNQDFAEFVTDEECERIEELLGLGFVAAQSFITAVRSRWTAVAPICANDYGIALNFSLGPKGHGLLKQSPPLASAPSYTVVEAINAIANYWKHVDDWPTRLVTKGKWRKPLWDFDSMKGNARRTAEIATALGMSPGSTGNLRTAVRALGISKYENLAAVRKELFDWADNLYKRGEADIRNAIK